MQHNSYFQVAGSTADKTPVQQNKGTSVFDSIEKPKSGQSIRTNMFMKQVSNDGKKVIKDLKNYITSFANIYTLLQISVINIEIYFASNYNVFRADDL